MKQPAFQFYPGDWIQDTRPLSLAAKGAWIDLLCAMWRSQTRGQLTLSMLGYSRLIGATVDQANSVIKELTDMQVCESETLSNGDVMITNRRMVREEKDRESNRLRVQRHRNASVKREENGNVTFYSSSSSSIPEETKDVSSAPSGAKRFTKPTPDEVHDYALTIGFTLDGQKFCDFYESKGWKVGNSPMKSWQAAVRTWKANGYSQGGNNAPRKVVGAAAIPDGKYDHLG